MRGIWSASTLFSLSTPFPSAKPEISVKMVKDGYRLDWRGLFPSDNPAKPMTIHNLYKREVDGEGKKNLVCYDATRPSRLLRENEMCESEMLERISVK